MNTADDSRPSDPSSELTPRNVSGFVLAGGRSSRLGRDKVLLPWNGATMLDHAVQRLAKICISTSLCADRDDLQQHLRTGSVRRINDAMENAGPLAAIVAGLEQTQTDWNLFLAVDLPLVPAEFLRWLVEHATRASEQAMCRMPRIDGRPEPLCAMYHRSLSTRLHHALSRGTYKILQALQDEEAGERLSRPHKGNPAVEFIDLNAIAEMTNIDSQFPVSDWFLNINTPQDWEQLLRLQNPEPTVVKAPA